MIEFLLNAQRTGVMGINRFGAKYSYGMRWFYRWYLRKLEDNYFKTMYTTLVISTWFAAGFRWYANRVATRTHREPWTTTDFVDVDGDCEPWDSMPDTRCSPDGFQCRKHFGDSLTTTN